jgi:syntaxin 18
MNLELQSEHVSQLVADSVFTTENVGEGNKQLQIASERPSTARMVFWATCGLCTTLVVWDLIF